MSISATPRAPWWAGETEVRLSAVPEHLPRLRTGRRVSLASVYRWTTAGLRGVRLRRYRVGGAWCTTVEEVRRWSRVLTELAGGDA